CAGLATVVVRVNVIDPQTLQAFEAFASGFVGRERGTRLRIVERDRREKNARAVEVKVPAFDPELAKTEPLRPTGVQHLTAGWPQGFGFREFWIEGRDFY